MPAENNDRAQISSGCWNDGCTKESESGCVQGFGARLTKKIGKCVLKCVLAKEKAVDSNESATFILVRVVIQHFLKTIVVQFVFEVIG